VAEHAIEDEVDPIFTAIIADRVQRAKVPIPERADRPVHVIAFEYHDGALGCHDGHVQAHLAVAEAKKSVDMRIDLSARPQAH
jgi:hypothetical protein